jgi:hypothetical protein
MKTTDFKKILANGHLYRDLYHFTDKSNISSIKQHGILSKAELARRNFKVENPGGNDLSVEAGAKKGILDFVSLCFTHSHPMCYVAQEDGRIPNPQYLTISADVLDIPGTKISLGVANKTGVELLDVELALDRMDMQVLYTRTDWTNPEIQTRLRAAEKYEVLVPTIISVDLIRL